MDPKFFSRLFSLSALLTDANWAYCLSWYIYFCFCSVLVTLEGFTVAVANDGKSLLKPGPSEIDSFIHPL